MSSPAQSATPTTDATSSTAASRTAARPTLVYVYDALCSWCFGFEPVIDEIARTYASDVDLQVVSGGMNLSGTRIKDILGADPRPIYQRIIDTTGAPIESPYLDGLVERDNYAVDSLRPALAMSAYRTLTGDAGDDLRFAIAMQTAMYTDGLAPADDDYYRRAAQTVGVDADALLAEMTSEASRSGADQDFALTQGLGVRGFPAVFLRDVDGAYLPIGSGYRPLAETDDALARGLEFLAARTDRVTVLTPPVTTASGGSEAAPGGSAAASGGSEAASADACVDGSCALPGDDR